MNGSGAVASLLRGVLAFAFCAPAWAADDRLVGVWEFSRFDNVPRIEAPEPDNVANVLYIFYNDHELVYFYPGGEIKLPDSRNNLPFKDRVPYELQGSRFRGFLGLTNDLTGTAQARFPAEDEFEVHYPDGSFAVLTRISKDPNVFKTPKLHCVPLTVRGINFDADRVATVRREVREATRNESLERRLLGRWQSYSDDPKGAVLTLEFKPDSRLRNTVTRPQHPDWEPDVFDGSFQVKGSYLVSDRHCFSPEKIWFDGEELRLSLVPSFTIPFRRIETTENKP